ncbi:SDR family NAD(P)-dependent oxidoreductase [Nonomuraea sp. FMUSA5-5]|uniref:SDR family NAD(P)-dependent oxidoreductase n=1 Tax=Nonomuraea composti TaxID=2720023 RepID=A0ABX1BIZ4_9ACTN|nr:SDR family NAD(P)-dependent oxidoreductase [Nonomuraea sp. FMUSA5-5]NJP97703.1 SDR family NAD(P)-dependent oxidoreductase [Nonomuraea sp. FMUSA5-5]
MTARTIVLTGATSGIGLATARLLARSGHRLILHGPEPRPAVEPLLAELPAPAPIDYVPGDFGDLGQAAALADRVGELTGHVDVLINNAGRPGPPARSLSRDGHEITFQVNYLAAVLLTERLAPLLRGGRVVHVASATHLSASLDADDLGLERHPYSPTIAYARSKLAMVMHALWQARHPGPAIVAISPGVISTGLLHAMYGAGGAPTGHGARNVVQAATAPSLPAGTYLDDGEPARPGRQARDHTAQDALRQATTRLLRPWL